MGISDFAQKALGDLVFVDLPEVGSSVKAGEPAAAVESVKSAADIYSPLDGEVVESNEDLSSAPDMVNKMPFEDGWMFKVKVADGSQMDALLSPEEYEKHTAE